VPDVCQSRNSGYVVRRGSQEDRTTLPKKPMTERQLVLTTRDEGDIRLPKNMIVFVCVRLEEKKVS